MNDPQVEYTIKHEERKMAQATLSTEAKKNKFVYDIKSGLGEMIKEEPNKPQIKVTWYRKLIKMIFND